MEFITDEYEQGKCGSVVFLTEHVELEELPNGRKRLTIHPRQVAVRENGSLVAIDTAFGDGDASTPHIVTRAPLRTRVANDSMRRLYPIPGDDDSYLEIGAPFVRVNGTWTQVSLGTPSRSANLITWTRPQSITRILHGGNFVKLDIELRNGFVPEDSQIAFPVGIQNLTRSGTAILKDGVPVMQLRPFVMEDVANLEDVRPIAHQFVNLNSQPYLLLTLPDLTGMSRPRIDPTLSLQPDATDGVDTVIRANTPTTNYGTDVHLRVGEETGNPNFINRTLIKFDLSTLPADATIDSATFSLQATVDASNSATTYRVYRLKRAWTELGATWNTYDGTNSWQTAGGFGADDCEQTDIGSRAFTATETIGAGEFKDFALTPTTKADLDLGNGWLVKADGEVNDAYRFGSSDDITGTNHPKLVIEYTEGGAGPDYTLEAAQGSYTLSGQAVSLLVSRVMTAGAGAYTLTGQDAGLFFGRHLTAGAGSYSLTGQDASLLVSRLLTAETGAYTLTGRSVTLVYSGEEPLVTPDSRVYVIPTEDRVFVIIEEDRTFVVH